MYEALFWSFNALINDFFFFTFYFLQLVYELLIDTIQKCYPDVHYENIPYTFPR